MSKFHDRLAGFFRNYGILVGRLALVVLFVHSAINHITGFAASVENMQSKLGGVPEPVLHFLLGGAIVFLLAGSLMVALGWQVRMGAMLLFIFLVAVTPIFHAFWAVPADEYRMQLVQFEKNLAIMGGLWVLLAAGGGPFSFDKPRPAT